MTAFNLNEKLSCYKPVGAEEEAVLSQIQQFLTMAEKAGVNPYCRSTLVGHIIADAWIVNPARDKVLLLQHGDDGLWVGPGGHCDGSSDVYAAALREVLEETGLSENHLTLLGDAVFDLSCAYKSTHLKYGKIEPTHLHLNVCFLFEADESAPLRISHESRAMQWVALEDAERMNMLLAHQCRIPKTRALQAPMGKRYSA